MAEFDQVCKFSLQENCANRQSCHSHDASKKKMVCKYYQMGYCMYGPDCRYEHIVKNDQLQEPSAANVCTPVITEETIMCLFFERDGNCHNGERCQYAHGLTCDICCLPKLHPVNEKQKKEHTEQCMREIEEEMEVTFGIQASEEKSCGLCMEKILNKENMDEAKVVDKRFGIMEKCTHIFCLRCILMWRQGRSPYFHTEKHCPMCKTVSDLVIPSRYWIDIPEEKESLISNYKRVMRELKSYAEEYLVMNCANHLRGTIGHALGESVEYLVEMTIYSMTDEHDVSKIGRKKRNYWDLVPYLERNMAETLNKARETTLWDTNLIIAMHDLMDE